MNEGVCAPRRSESQTPETESGKGVLLEPRTSKKESCTGFQEKWAGPLPSAVQDRDGCVNARSVSSSGSGILRGSVITSSWHLRVKLLYVVVVEMCDLDLALWVICS